MAPSFNITAAPGSAADILNCTMPFNQYHFEDHWLVPFPPDDVWEVLSHSKSYPLWWKPVYLSAQPLDGVDKPQIGGRVAVVARGKLPYRLRFTIETTKLEKPRIIEFKASGDFRTDASRWILKPHASGTEVILDWNPIVDKPIIKLLSPFLKPLFRWNHAWAMKIGEREIVAYLQEKRR
jgi:hypothetical protein